MKTPHQIYMAAWYQTNKERLLVKNREALKLWRKKNPEMRRRQERRWRDKNRTTVRSRMARYRIEHKQEIRAATARWRELNRELVRNYWRRFYRNHPAKVKAAARRWQKANPEIHQEHRRKTKSKAVSELKDHYVADELVRTQTPVTPENLDHIKLRIRLCRTRKLFATLALAGVLKPTQTPL